ncbi:MAG: sulfite exporter TauE/SafE family protein [Rubrivivax sp.]|jgi:hypothetical protein|nr:sulfite exporter TauE/SafE family protein [Rubrivivax sp.]
MPDWPWTTLLAAAVAVMLAYTVYGLTGFGAAIVAIPLLAQVLPLRFAVPMMLLFDLVAGLLLGLKNRRNVDRRELLRLVPFLLVGMVAGVVLLARAPERGLLAVLGLFAVLYSGWNLLRKATTAPIAPGWAVPAGLVGGAFTSMYGTGGPIYASYLARRVSDKDVLRASVAALIFGAGWLRLAMFTAGGFYAQSGLLVLAAVLLPAALTGYFIGSRLHARLSGPQAFKAVWLLVCAAGLGLLWRVVAPVVAPVVG